MKDLSKEYQNDMKNQIIMTALGDGFFSIWMEVFCDEPEILLALIEAFPTNYDSKKNFFDTSAVEAVIKLVIQYNLDEVMVIKSTIPVGFTASVRAKYHCDNII